MNDPLNLGDDPDYDPDPRAGFLRIASRRFAGSD